MTNKDEEVVGQLMCTKCGRKLPQNEFYVDKRWRTGRRSACKQCIDNQNSKYYKKHHYEIMDYHHDHYIEHIEAKKSYDLERAFGITLEDYKVMWENQHGQCAICGKMNGAGKLLAVDHDHVTGKVRGLLCDNCNLGLGKFKENMELLNNAIDYLLGDNNE